MIRTLVLPPFPTGQPLLSLQLRARRILFASTHCTDLGLISLMIPFLMLITRKLDSAHGILGPDENVKSTWSPQQRPLADTKNTVAVTPGASDYQHDHQQKNKKKTSAKEIAPYTGLLRLNCTFNTCAGT